MENKSAGRACLGRRRKRRRAVKCGPWQLVSPWLVYDGETHGDFFTYHADVRRLGTVDEYHGVLEHVRATLGELAAVRFTRAVTILFGAEPNAFYASRSGARVDVLQSEAA